jgi:hypothetical protein
MDLNLGVLIFKLIVVSDHNFKVLYAPQPFFITQLKRPCMLPWGF